MDRAERLEPARVAPLEVLEFETVDTVIASLLGADPPPHVFAVAENGLCIPMPPDVPVRAECCVSGVASALELCMPADLTSVVEAWERARIRRGAHASIHLRHDPERSVMLHFVDARHRFGVYLGILVGTRGWIEGNVAKPSLFRPRLCTMQRDEVSVIRGVDTATTQILGWTAEELIGGRTIDLVHPDDRASAIANWMEMLSRPGSDQRVLLRYRHRDGKFIWFEITHRNLLNDPAQRCVLTEMLDVSERMEAIEALRASEELLRRLTETLPLGIAQIDGNRQIVYRNERLLEIVGMTDAATIGDQFCHVAHADRDVLESALTLVLSSGDAVDVELSIDLEAGPRRCSVATRSLRAESGAVTGAIVCVTDITERVRLREELEARATFDDLTRCHNRASILDALEGALQRSTKPRGGMAVVFVDLDRFKQINDRYGHAAGDELLRLTAERLLASVRTGDVVGRFGGDEFLVVCPDVATPAMALDLAQRIAAALAQGAMLGTASIVPGSSIGVAWTDHAVGCDAIVATADEAMYESKRAACGPVLVLR